MDSRCGLCLGVETPVASATPHRRAVVRDLFSFWPDDVAVVACSDCFRTIDDFYVFYERVRDNQLVLRAAEPAKAVRTSAVSREIKEEEEIKVEVDWNDIVIKQEDSNGVFMDKNEVSDDDDDDVDDDEDVSDRIPIASFSKLSKERKKVKSTKYGDNFNYPTEIIRDGKFVVSKKLLNQMATNFYNIQCEDCKKKFEKLSQLVRHFDKVHNSRPFVNCCNRKIHQTDFMYQHMAKHLQPSAFQCPVCNKEFSRIAVLKNHLGYHVPEEERIHRCDQCNKSFAHKALLTRHMDSHVPESEKKVYKCEPCAKTFTNYYAHFNHITAVHSIPKFLCPECGKKFRLKCNYLMHLETHSGKKIQCPVCEVMCKSFALRKHMKIHNGERFNCEQCEYSTPHKCHLRRHMQTKHSDEKPFICNVCGKQFKLNKNLETHMAQHTGERKYSCPYCPKTFASSGNFSTHRKRMHDEAYRNSLLRK